MSLPFLVLPLIGWSLLGQGRTVSPGFLNSIDPLSTLPPLGSEQLHGGGMGVGGSSCVVFLPVPDFTLTWLFRWNTVDLITCPAQL